VQLEIVDKAKESTAALGIKVIVGLGNELGSRHAGEHCMSDSPGFSGWEGEFKCADAMRRVAGIARYAIGRWRTWSEPRVFDTDVGRPLASARK